MWPGPHPRIVATPMCVRPPHFVEIRGATSGPPTIPLSPAPFIFHLETLPIWHGSSLSFSMGVKIGLITFLHAVHLGSRLYLRVIRVPNPKINTERNINKIDQNFGF